LENFVSKVSYSDCTKCTMYVKGLIRFVYSSRPDPDWSFQDYVCWRHLKTENKPGWSGPHVVQSGVFSSGRRESPSVGPSSWWQPKPRRRRRPQTKQIAPRRPTPVTARLRNWASIRARRTARPPVPGTLPAARKLICTPGRFRRLTNGRIGNGVTQSCTPVPPSRVLYHILSLDKWREAERADRQADRRIMQLVADVVSAKRHDDYLICKLYRAPAPCLAEDRRPGQWPCGQESPSPNNHSETSCFRGKKGKGVPYPRRSVGGVLISFT